IKAEAESSDSGVSSGTSSPGPAWSQNKNERQRLLQQRRDEMILAARRRILEKEKAAAAANERAEPIHPPAGPKASHSSATMSEGSIVGLPGVQQPEGKHFNRTGRHQRKESNVVNMGISNRANKEHDPDRHLAKVHVAAS
ncbi:hypothetical protein KEM56_000342, partial [Ascosphaera pollenicola]